MTDQSKKDKAAYAQLDLICSALSAIDGDFFRIITTANPEGIVRERVFCYELYHQLRLLNKSIGRGMISWHGEIDKSGHPDFRRESQINPDFVFHLPGSHEMNCLVVEVKGTLDRPENVAQDFHKIIDFVSNYNYSLGVFVLYNNSISDFYSRFKKMVKDEGAGVDRGRIHILAIATPGMSVERTTLTELEKQSKLLSP